MVLGLGYSGKSSIIRQIKNSEDYEEIPTEEGKEEEKKDVFSTLVQSQFSDSRVDMRRKLEIFEVKHGGRKWLHFISNMNALIFVVDSSCGNVELLQSLDLFKCVWNYIQQFRHPIVVHVFLHKQDLLEEKIKSGDDDLKKYFPDFAHFSLSPRVLKRNDVLNAEYLHAKYFIRTLFQQIVDQGSIHCSLEMAKQCYIYFTSASDNIPTTDAVQSCVQRLLPCVVNCES